MLSSPSSIPFPNEISQSARPTLPMETTSSPRRNESELDQHAKGNRKVHESDNGNEHGIGSENGSVELFPSNSTLTSSIEEKPKHPPTLIDPNVFLSATQSALEQRSGPIQRLVITFMVLENFKSYAGTQKIGPLHKSFTAVVGANGSGKSNIIDALLFVFGYRANKLRQSKLGQLIHHSDNYPDLTQCTVVVHFQEILEYPDQSTIIVPDSDFSISRTAYRNHSSKYAINQETRTFAEVASLLKKKQVDLDNHRFLILQGEVESIAQMKAKAPNEHEDGLLEYLEDIIGTRHYKAPIEEALVELEEVNEKRNEKLARAVFVEQEKKKLEGAKTKAEHFLNIEQQCHQYQAWLLHDHLNHQREKMEACLEKQKEVVDKLSQLEETSKSMTSEYTELEASMENAQDELKEAHMQVQKYEKELMLLSNEDAKVNELKKGVNRKLEKIQKAIEKHKFTISEQERWLTNDAQDTDKVAAELGQLQMQHEKNVEVLEKMNMELRFKTHDLQVQLDQMKTEALPLKSECKRSKGQVELAQAELETLLETRQRNQHTIEQLQEKITIQAQEIEVFQQEMSELNDQRQPLTQKMTSYQAQLRQNQQEQIEKRKELHEVRIKLEETKASMDTQQSTNQVLNALLKLKNQVPGIYHRLGHLGTIDPQFDVAVSTAFPGLDYVVVDTVSTGQQCLDFLRTQKLGRVHLICLDKLPKFQMQGVNTPEKAPRLFDQVQCKDERFKPAFYHVMRDTLVARDLEQANRIAFTPGRRWRVVTLDGQVIDTSGTMSGGGHQIIRGKMLPSSASGLSALSPFHDENAQMPGGSRGAASVLSLEKARTDLTEDLRELTETQRQLEAQVQQCTEALTKLDKQMAMARLELEQKQLKQNEDQASFQQLASQHPNEERVRAQKHSELEETIERLSRSVAGLQTKVAKMDALIEAKQDEIDEVGGMEYKVLKYQVQTDAAEIEKLNHKVAKSSVHKKQARKQKTESEKQLKEAEQEYIHLKEEIKRVQDHSSSQKEKIKALNDQLKRAKKVWDEHEAQVQTLQQEMDSHSEHMLAYKKEKAKLLRTKESTQHELYQAQQQVDQLQEKWDRIQEKLKHAVNSLLSNTSLTIKEVQAKLHHLKQELQLLSGEVQVSVLEEYAQREQEHQTRLQELASVSHSRDQVKAKCDELKKNRFNEFITGFALISQRLKEMYQLITCGGNAELELVDSMDPFSEGILFSVMPPKKSWKQIQHLSGGEKTLASLALVFALHHYKPNPIYVMDEIDAALDFRNVSIIAHYIKEQTQTAQFIIISLRHNMFELSDRLVGIYKTDQCSKSISVNPLAYEICNVTPTT